MLECTLQRNGRYWRASWITPDGRRKHKNIGPADSGGRKPRLTEAAARRLCHDLERKLNAGMSAIGRGPRLGDWLDQYDRLRTDLADSSRIEVNTTRAYLLEHFKPDCRIDRITRAMAAEFRAFLAEKGMKEQTVRKHLRNCKAIFGRQRGALSLDLIEFNPFDRQVATVATVDKNWSYISADKMALLLQACPDRSWRCLIALCRWAGLRRGEATRLQWQDIDWNQKRLTVQHDGEQTTKRRKRVVPIQPALMAELLARFEEAEAGEPVFADKPHRLTADFQVIVKRAELETWPKLFHTLRKNCETDLLQMFPVFDVCDWLGHSATVSREHYHQTTEATMKAVSEGQQSESWCPTFAQNVPNLPSDQPAKSS